MESFLSDIYYEDIHIRDNLQFELESDFAPMPSVKKSISTQEFYFFIPASLQINQHTYSREQFYKDRTNHIRYKTPEFSLRELVDPHNGQSPINRIKTLESASQTSHNVISIQDELKLLGNIVRSALRREVRALLDYIETPMRLYPREEFETKAFNFCKEVVEFRICYVRLEKESLSHWTGVTMQTFLSVDEFISTSIDYYFTGFLEVLRASKCENVQVIAHQFCEIIASEKRHREQYFHEPKDLSKEALEIREQRLYHRGLLNKYVMDALLLGLERTSWVDTYGHYVGGIAAGIAMLVYVLIVFLNGPSMGFNSLPFLLLTVFIYILKDRIKDSLKTLFSQRAGQWFSDYTTQIRSPTGERVLGKLKEYFSFVAEQQVPDDILHIRQTQFHTYLAPFKPPETVFYYKKEMELGSDETVIRQRRHKLHNIFLFNVHLLIEKASNPLEPILHLDQDTMELQEFLLPKVYHLNVIMKNTFLQQDLQKKIEIKKFRLILDKTGIKRVESLSKHV